MLEGHSFSKYPAEASLSGSFQDAAARVLAGLWVCGSHRQVGAASGKEGGHPAKGDQCSGCRPGWCAGLGGMRATLWRRISGTRCGAPRSG